MWVMGLECISTRMNYCIILFNREQQDKILDYLIVALGVPLAGRFNTVLPEMYKSLDSRYGSIKRSEIQVKGT